MAGTPPGPALLLLVGPVADGGDGDGDGLFGVEADGDGDGDGDGNGDAAPSDGALGCPVPLPPLPPR